MRRQTGQCCDELVPCRIKGLFCADCHYIHDGVRVQEGSGASVLIFRVKRIR